METIKQETFSNISVTKTGYGIQVNDGRYGIPIETASLPSLITAIQKYLPMGKTKEEIMHDHLDPHDFIKKDAYEAVLEAMEEYRNQPYENHEYITDANYKSLTCRKCNDRIIIEPSEIKKPLSENDLVSFGNYLLSEARDSKLNEVSHADLENWKHLTKG